MSNLVVTTNLSDRHRGGFGKSPIFIRFAKPCSKEEESVELTPYNPNSSRLRITNAIGDELWTLDRLSDPRKFRLEVDINNLNEGTYYVEIQDGFFHQVRMVRIAAA